MEVQSFLVGLKFVPVFGTWLLTAYSDAGDRTEARIFGYFTLISCT
jgi:hypothetical protein